MDLAEGVVNASGVLVGHLTTTGRFVPLNEGDWHRPPLERITDRTDAHAAQDPDCLTCLGTGLVCEEHPDQAWGDGIPGLPLAGACYCGAAGMPCLLGEQP